MNHQECPPNSTAETLAQIIVAVLLRLHTEDRAPTGAENASGCLESMVEHAP